MSNGEVEVLISAQKAGEGYGSLVAEATALQKELETYYLGQEAHIRKRVALLDELQSCIAEERRCLEAQHQECRKQISVSRRNMLTVQQEQKQTKLVLSTQHETIEKEEAQLDQQLAELAKRIADADKLLQAELDKKNEAEKEESVLAEKERRQYDQDQDLEKTMRDLRKLSREIDERKTSLEAKNDTINGWNRTLEERERDLTQRQDKLRDDLQSVETEERGYGIGRLTSASIVAPLVSQRQVMDDHDMSIQRDEDQEEIDIDSD